MKDDEILEFLKDDEENNHQLEISASIIAILTVLINNKMTTLEEYQAIKKYAFEIERKRQVKEMSDEAKKSIEVVKKFNDLFGIDITKI